MREASSKPRLTERWKTMEGWNQEGSTSRKVTVVIEIADDIAVKRRTKLNVSQKQMAEKMNLKQATPIWHARTQPQLRL